MAVGDFLRRTFVRDTVSTRFIPEIDGLRFVAIALVFLHHLGWYLGRAGEAWQELQSSSLLPQMVLRHGHFGVQLFFVISGFVLALPFAGWYLAPVPGAVRPSLKAYLWRRVTRLEPPYLLNLLLLYFALLLTARATGGQLLPHLFASTTYLHNAIYGEGSKINLVAWSLEIEVQFYLLAPLLAHLIFRGASRVRRPLLAGAILAAPLLQILFIPPYGRAALSFLNHIQFFLCGFLLADLYVVDWRKSPQRIWTADIAAAIGSVLFFVLVNIDIPAGRMLLPPAFFAIAVGALRGKLTAAVLSHPVLTGIGGMCYTIYLFHSHIIAGAVRLTSHVLLPGSYGTNLLLQVVLTGIPTLLLCSLFFLLVERPCMDRTWPAKAGAYLGRLSRSLIRRPVAVESSTAQAN